MLCIRISELSRVLRVGVGLEPGAVLGICEKGVWVFGKGCYFRVLFCGRVLFLENVGFPDLQRLVGAELSRDTVDVQA